jgi:hypothetical protein
MKEKEITIPAVTFKLKVVTTDDDRLDKVFLGNKEIALDSNVKGEKIDLAQLEKDIANPPVTEPQKHHKPPIYIVCWPFRRPDGTIFYWHCIEGGTNSC